MSDDPPRDQPSGSGPDRDLVEAALAAAAAVPVTVSAERLSALEARVMGAVADRDDRGPVAGLASAPVTRIRRRNRAVSLLSAAAAVVVVALGALTVALLVGDDDALAIAAADRVVVELPDGESVAGEAGTELPDGARLEVIGFVEIDGQRFGPGSYRIVDGEVVATESDTTEPAATEPAPSADASGGFGEDGSDSSDRPAVVNDDGADGDGVDGDGSVPTSVVDAARSDDDSDEPAPDDGRDGTDGGSEGRPDVGAVPSPTDPSRSTVPQRSPDVTRPPAPTTAPVRQTTVPERPTTAVPSRRPTTTVTSTTSTTTTTTTASTTAPARATVVDGDGDPPAGRP